MRCRAGAALLALAVAVVACESGSGGATRVTGRSPLPAAASVYVAVGGGETFGVTLAEADRLREVWPQVLYRRALPQEAVFYNVARPGGLTADVLPAVLALVDELKPTVTTLWLDSNDERQITDVVQALRRGGATRVLVADTNDVVARVAADQGATVVAVAGAPVSSQDHRAVATAFAAALRGAKR